MRHWDRLFFINRRRLNNYITSGAIESGSSAIRLVGMPKSDCLVDGSLTRDAVLEAHGMDPGSDDGAVRTDLDPLLFPQRDG